MKSRSLADLSLIALLVPIPAAHADVVTDWNAVMVTTISGQNPFAQARIAAIVHLAVFEAVNTITHDYEPFLGTFLVTPQPASPEAAAVAAAHRVLLTYFPGALVPLDMARARSLAALEDGPAKANGLAVGEASAAAMVALRANDGSSSAAFHMPSSVEPGVWQPTPGCPPAGGILTHWGDVTPFGIKSATQFRSAPPPPLTSRRYARDFNK